MLVLQSAIVPVSLSAIVCVLTLAIVSALLSKMVSLMLSAMVSVLLSAMLLAHLSSAVCKSPLGDLICHELRRAAPQGSRFDIIGPLFREGTLGGRMLQQNANGAIIKRWLSACRGSVVASMATSVTASVATSANAFVRKLVGVFETCVGARLLGDAVGDGVGADVGVDEGSCKRRRG